MSKGRKQAVDVSFVYDNFYLELILNCKLYLKLKICFAYLQEGSEQFC